MADEENKLVRWTGDFGWNTVFAGIATASIVVGGVLAVGNSMSAVTELRNIVGEIQKANASFSERITRVEGRLDSVEKQGDRIERKIDIIGGPATFITPPAQQQPRR